jgi:hypothetical protein
MLGVHIAEADWPMAGQLRLQYDGGDHEPDDVARDDGDALSPLGNCLAANTELVTENRDEVTPFFR